MTIILGIDPALGTCGWGIVKFHNNSLTYIASGTVTTNNKKPIAERLLELHETIEQVIKDYQPDSVAIEETFVNKNPISSLKLGHARGAIMLSCVLSGLPIYEYAATLIKKTVVGAGRADKQQVVAMLKYLLPNSNITAFDEADAVAAAICHTQHLSIHKLKAS
jgi:crossover junction endodeoxyribonuclease RuvC